MRYNWHIFWSNDTSNTFLKFFFASSLSRRHRVAKCRKTRDDEQVWANFKPVGGLCTLKRNDGPEAMKEDGGNEDYPGDTAWGNPMPSTDSLPKENNGLSLSSSSWGPRVRVDAASSTHSTERHGARLTPAPKRQGGPSIDFQTPSDEGKDMKDHIIRNTCSQFGNDIDKLVISPWLRRCRVCSWTIACGPLFILVKKVNNSRELWWIIRFP